MSYQVLARKWRPKSFASLVGQEHVVRALTHALGEQRLAGKSALLLAAALGLGAWIYGWWLLILWTVLLAALLGGRVIMVAHRPTRLFYLLAFAYLLAALLVFLVPQVVPEAVPLGAALDAPFALAAPVVFVAMLLLPRPESAGGAGGRNGRLTTRRLA